MNMGPENTESAEKAQQLADELSALSEQHSKSLQTAAYISMSKEEPKEYDRRRTRISEICTLLGKFKPVQNAIESHTEEIYPGASGGETEPEQTP